MMMSIDPLPFPMPVRGPVLPPLLCRRLPIPTARQPSDLQWVSARRASLPMILPRINAELDEATHRPQRDLGPSAGPSIRQPYSPHITALMGGDESRK